jgi:CheY-like chemotaxis protein
MPTIAPTLLVIDDDDMVRRSLARVLRRKYAVTELGDAESAIALIEAGKSFDVILCDLNLDGMSGREFLLHLDTFHEAVVKRVVILSGSSRQMMDDDVLVAIAPRFIEKPASLAAIDAVIQDLVRENARAA